jgi:acyl carrier protein
MQTRSRERTGAGGSFNWGHPKRKSENAAATTSRCVGSDKVDSRSCDRPAIIHSFDSAAVHDQSVSHQSHCHSGVLRARTKPLRREDKVGKTMDIRDFSDDKVRQLIADYLGVDASQITDEAHLSDDLGVDWLDQLELLMLIEDEFVGVEFSDVTAIEVVGDLIRHMEMARHVLSAHRRSAA